MKRTTSDPRDWNQSSFRANTRPSRSSTSRGPRHGEIAPPNTCGNAARCERAWVLPIKGCPQSCPSRRARQQRWPTSRHRPNQRPRRPRRRPTRPRRRPGSSLRGTSASATAAAFGESCNFRRFVLGCIDTDFGHQIIIFQHFSRSTRFSQFCAARISKFCKISSKFS